MYKCDSIGALRHRNQWGSVEKIRAGGRECTGREMGQWSVGEKDKRNYGLRNDDHRKEKLMIERRWEGMWRVH